MCRLTVALAVCLVVATVGAEAKTAAPTVQPKVYQVVVSAMHFGPVPPVLHPGDTILWINRDIFRHSVTAKNHSFDVDLPVKASVRQRFPRAGIFPFACKYHPGMRGQVVVQ